MVAAQADGASAVLLGVGERSGGITVRGWAPAGESQLRINSNVVAGSEGALPPLSRVPHCRCGLYAVRMRPPRSERKIRQAWLRADMNISTITVNESKSIRLNCKFTSSGQKHFIDLVTSEAD